MECFVPFVGEILLLECDFDLDKQGSRFDLLREAEERPV